MKTTTITKKTDKGNFDAIMYCIKAKVRDPDPATAGLEYLCIKQGRLMATDGHRLHITRISIPDGMYEYSKARTTITLKPVKSKFPNIKAVMPTTFDHIVKVDTAKLLQLCKMAAIISDHYFSTFKLTFDGYLNVEMVDPDVGNMTGQVDIDEPIDPELKVGINVNYLIDALKGLDKLVTIKLQHTNNAPMIFRDKSKMALIMPMRV